MKTLPKVGDIVRLSKKTWREGSEFSRYDFIGRVMRVKPGVPHGGRGWSVQCEVIIPLSPFYVVGGIASWNHNNVEKVRMTPKMRARLVRAVIEAA